MEGLTPSLGTLRNTYGVPGGTRRAMRADAATERPAASAILQNRDDSSEANRLLRENADGGGRNVNQVVADANRRLEVSSHSLRFRINEDYDGVQVQIVDSERDKVIRSIPSEEMLKLSARMREASGIGQMVDVSR